jgi:hypothetical protein
MPGRFAMDSDSMLEATLETGDALSPLRLFNPFRKRSP